MVDCTAFRDQPLGVLGGREPAQSLLRPLLVVLASPGLDEDLGMGQTREPVLVETLVGDITQSCGSGA